MARTTTTRRPGLLARLRGAPKTVTTTHTTTTTTRRSPRTGMLGGRKNKGHANNYNTTTGAPVQHHRRKVSMGDKVSGAMMKLRGSLTRRPGLKAAGTRRMHGTDGRGAHHVAAY